MDDAGHVLIVDDHEDFREMLTTVLESEGFRVDTAGNGAEALARLEVHKPRLILLDLMMPIMSGDVFRQRQLADLRFKDIPVVCMTAAPDACTSMPLDAGHCFQKPVDFDRLVDTVRRYVPVRRSGLTAS